MKKYIILFLAVTTVLFVACNGSKSNSVRDEARESLELEDVKSNLPAITNPIVTPPPAGTTVAAAGSVQHYTCPNNCEGSGGGAAGSCPVCGSEYAHNQAWHNQNNAGTVATPGTQGLQNITPPAATNAAGVYHYTCPQGCTGGAGAAGTCSTCGGALAHNTAFHE